MGGVGQNKKKEGGREEGFMRTLKRDTERVGKERKRRKWRIKMKGGRGRGEIVGKGLREKQRRRSKSGY